MTELLKNVLSAQSKSDTQIQFRLSQTEIVDAWIAKQTKPLRERRHELDASANSIIEKKQTFEKSQNTLLADIIKDGLTNAEQFKVLYTPWYPEHTLVPYASAVVNQVKAGDGTTSCCVELSIRLLAVNGERQHLTSQELYDSGQYSSVLYLTRRISTLTPTLWAQLEEYNSYIQQLTAIKKEIKELTRQINLIQEHRKDILAEINMRLLEESENGEAMIQLLSTVKSFTLPDGASSK